MSRTKWIALILAGMFISNVATKVVMASEGYRFYHVYEEVVHNQSLKPTTFIVYHDQSTGNEIICAQQGNTANISCFQSGRNWK